MIRVEIPKTRPSRSDWAYASGFLEGDGSLGIFRQTRKNGSLAYSSFMPVHNTELAILKWFKKVFGGNIAFYKARANNSRFKGRKPVWAWTLQQQNHEWFVSRIAPFLRGEKARKAKLVLKFRTHKGARGNGLGGNIKAQACIWRRYAHAFG
jgi:hypothetical protein